MAAEPITEAMTDMRAVPAPRGAVWRDGDGRWAGGWIHPDEVEDTDAGRVLYPRPFPNDDVPPAIRDVYVFVPADEPASKADLMELAATVRFLRTRLLDLESLIRAAGRCLTSPVE